MMIPKSLALTDDRELTGYLCLDMAVYKFQKLKNIAKIIIELSIGK